MFDYKAIVNNAKTYGRCPGFMPNDPNYKAVCDWIRTLPEEYRMKMHSFTVVKKHLPDDPKYDVIIEFHHKSKLVTVGFTHKVI